MDNEFLNKLSEILEANLENEHFGVSELAKELGMSRSNLHRKIIVASKISANQYIRQFRLQKGMALLKQTSLTVSEVAYKTGFSSPSYFIKCFHDFYGYSPGKVGNREEDEVNLVHSKSIIVLPFENISPDADQEYFCDGLTEEIITDLSHIHELLVISRISAMTFKGTKNTIKEIAEKVNVQYVLEGSVRKSGNNLRITAQLIDAENDTHLWAEKYNESLDSIFEIQENVSRSIIDALTIKLSTREEKQIADRPIEDIQAYDCYLRALREMTNPNEVSINKALRDLQVGIDLIGDNAVLYAGMGTAYCNFYEFGISVTEKTLIKAEEYSFKVQKLAPDSSLGYSLLGRIERFRGNALRALKYFKQANDIDPSDPESLGWLGIEYNWKFGYPDLAFPFIKQMIERDPLSPLSHLFLGLYHFLSSEFDSALKSYNNMLKLAPNHLLANFWSVYALLWSKQNEKAYALIDRMSKVESPEQMHKLFTGWLLFIKNALDGKKSKALEFLTDDLIHFFWSDPEFPWIGAGGYALINEKEEAIRWLEHAINKGCINYPILAETDPFLKNIRGEARFKKLMEHIKPKWENFNV